MPLNIEAGAIAQRDRGGVLTARGQRNLAGRGRNDAAILVFQRQRRAIFQRQRALILQLAAAAKNDMAIVSQDRIGAALPFTVRVALSVSWVVAPT